jgi:putative sugar O-methyltransferase
MYDSCYLQLARMLAEQKIHLHIYPHWFYRSASGSAFNFDLKADFRDFFRLQQETPYLHVHESLPLDQLARELPQYDFGIISGGAPAFGQKLGFLTEKYMRACYSGRIADYLDARLPILINREVGFNYWLLERYGIAVDLAGLLHSGFRDKLLAVKQDRIRAANVGLAARKLSISAQANRLANFYEDIVSERQPRALRLPYWMKAAKIISQVGRPQRKIARELDTAVPTIQAMLNNSRAENASQTTSVQARGQDDHAGMETDQPSKSRKALRKLALTLPPLRRIVQERDAYALQARKLHGQVRQLTWKLTDLRMQNVGLQTQLGTLHGTNDGLQTQLDALHTNALQASVGAFHSEINLEGAAINEISGLLNWPAIMDDCERNNGFTELLRLIQLWSRHGLRAARGGNGTVHSKQTSAAWQLLNRKNLDQLLREGHRNFKRTIALNYFTFPVQAGDPQIASLEAKLDPVDIEGCWRLAQTLPNDPNFDLPDQLHYRYVVLLLWTYARRIDHQKYLDRLKEPAEGNPVLVPVDGQSASQDIANSVIEYYSMREGVAFESCRRVLEIGAGYGRNAQVILELHPNIQYTIIDIPPALYIAQRYLSTLFRDRPIFRVSDFTSYKEVQDEMEHSSIVFLLPHQMALLPDRHFNLTLNISSFGELTREEIDYYFVEVDRVTEGYLYTKQWMQSKNPFDGLVLMEADYPVRPHWKKIYSRACAVQSNFFEALYNVGDHA